MNKSTRNAILLAIGQQAWSRAVKEYQIRTNWTVSIGANDDLYFEVQEWLHSQNDDASPRRALEIGTKWVYVPEASANKPKLQVSFDGNASNKVVIDGHTVSVFLRDSDNPVSGSDFAKFLKPPRLVFKAKNRAGRDAVLGLMQKIHQEKHEKTKKPALQILGKYGDWERRSDLPGRTLESVVVKNNVVDELFRDLTEFRNQEKEYVRRGVPYHRAYLLTGPPGTGKTSSVKAVAQAAGLDLYYCQLAGIERDSKLLDLLTDIKPNSILLLEDIDSLSAATERNDEKNKISSSGLLNALDGVATPHGLVTILTTNHPDNLDEALVRPGRVDRIFEFEYPDSATMKRHFEFFYGQKPKSHNVKWAEGRSSAEVSEILKSHMDDPAGAERELKA